MARTESIGGSYTTPSRPSYAPGGILDRYQAVAGTPLETASIDDLISQTIERQRVLNDSRRYSESAALQKLVENYQHIKAYVPNRSPKKKNEATLNDIADLLLDLTGYGAAIAQFIPIPQVRIGGMLAGYASSAIRAGASGQTQSAVRQLNSATRAYYNYLGRAKRYR